MTAGELKRFPGLPANDNKYVLDFIGGVKTNLVEDDNPLLECFFTPLGGTQQNPYRNRKGQISVDLSVGYLPALILGRTFQNQYPLPLKDWMQKEQVILQIEFDSTSALPKRIADLDLSTPLSSDNNADVASRIHVKQVEGRIVAPQENVTARSIFVFPDIELIRFYLTNSSFSCRRLFGGDFQGHRIEKKVIYTKREPLSFDGNAKAGRFVYRLGYHGEKDALILGRILFDETGWALLMCPHL